MDSNFVDNNYKYWIKNDASELELLKERNELLEKIRLIDIEIKERIAGR